MTREEAVLLVSLIDKWEPSNWWQRTIKRYAIDYVTDKYITNQAGA